MRADLTMVRLDRFHLQPISPDAIRARATVIGASFLEAQP